MIKIFILRIDFVRLCPRLRRVLGSRWFTMCGPKCILYGILSYGQFFTPLQLVGTPRNASPDVATANSPTFLFLSSLFFMKLGHFEGLTLTKPSFQKKSCSAVLLIFASCCKTIVIFVVTSSLNFSTRFEMKEFCHFIKFSLSH